jgi:hypothetical protein
MSFNKRRKIGKIAADAVCNLFEDLKFKTFDFGYEYILPKNIRGKLISINSPTVHFIRFLPDMFVYLDKENVFFTEVKVCMTPIYKDDRVETLKMLSGIDTLTKKNIGAIETSAINNYKNLNKYLGVKILLVVYSPFHGRSLVANWIENIPIVHQDDVRIGEGNASNTPYTDVNLDDFKDIRLMLYNEFNIKEKESLSKAYKRCIKGIEI